MSKLPKVIVLDNGEIKVRCSKGDECLNPEKDHLGYLPDYCFSKRTNKKNNYRSMCKHCSVRLDKAKSEISLWASLRNLANAANGRCDIQVSTVDLFLLYLSQNGKCVYNNANLNLETMSLEHLQHVSKGGSNNIENLVLCSLPFNLARNHHFTIEQICWIIWPDEPNRAKEIQDRIDTAHKRYTELKFMVDFFPFQDALNNIFWMNFADNLPVQKTLVKPY